MARCLLVLDYKPLHVELEVPCGAAERSSVSPGGTTILNFTEVIDQSCGRGAEGLAVEAGVVVEDLRAADKKWAC